MPERIYLDHAATTPIVPAAAQAMAEGIGRWANPSSPHAEGRAARHALEEARARICAALKWDGALLFTSGATEAIRLAIQSAKADRALISAVEHDAVLRAAPSAERLPVTPQGQVEIVGDATGALIAVQIVNNETGVIQSFSRTEEMLWLADCAQSAGKIPLPDADFIALSAHKFGGPPGIGALLVRDLATLKPSGGQEQGYRGGTENVPAALAFAAALDGGSDWMARASALRAELDTALKLAGAEIVAEGGPRLPMIASYRMPGVPAASQLIRFDLAGIAVSAGSACSSGSVKPSHVLAAMGWQETEAREVIRVSFGPTTNENEIKRFIEVWATMAGEARARAA